MQMDISVWICLNGVQRGHSEASSIQSVACSPTNDHAVTVIENGKDDTLFVAVQTILATPTFSPVTRPVLETFAFVFEEAQVTVFTVALVGRTVAAN